jgi:uncharacterized membrane protein YccC
LSVKAKEAIKTALAMTIAYGIALSMDWDRPFWAGFAVAFVSLATVGQSINKAALRMAGTLLATVVAFTLIALFAQERWLFILFLSLYGGFCTYMMSGSRSPYFWQVGCFVCVIICMDAGPDPVSAFETAVLRAQETGLGILVYSLIAIFLWPSTSHEAFNAAAGNLAATQHQLYQACLSLMRGLGSEQEVQRLKAQAIQVKTRFDQLLKAAEIDSYEVAELRQPWRCYQHRAAELTQTMARWHESFTEVQALDLHRLLPDLDAFGAELEGRLAAVGSILAGKPPKQPVKVVDLPYDKDAVRKLSHFDTAAFAVMCARLLDLERLTRSLLEAVSDIRGVGPAMVLTEARPVPTAIFIPDPDRLTSALRFMMIMWIAFLAVIYIDDLPGGTGIVSMAGSLGIALANMPQVSVSRLFVPAATSILFAAILYIFVMPQLSSFMGLGLLIFGTTFAYCYLFAEPRQMLGRALGLAMFVTIASISNAQSYNFLSVAATALMFPLLFMIIAITAYIPYSPHPERVFLRLLGRFFRSSAYLTAAMRWDSPHAATPLARWKEAFHAREVATLPGKLGTWAPSLDTRSLPGTAPEQVQALITSLHSLTNRMRQLLEMRDTPQAPFLVQELLEDLRVWRRGIKSALQKLSVDPSAGKQEAFHTALNRVVAHMETRIQDALNKAPAGQFSDQDAENFYGLLGAYRGVSAALVDYVGTAGVINWTPWREERF